jgi:serine protease Do
MAITRRVDSLLAQKSVLMARHLAESRFESQPAPAFAPRGWLGFLTQGPSEQIVDRSGQHVIYFAYPTIISVDPSSPAERAGIAPGDVLVAYNGLDVVNRDFNLTRLLRPDRKIAITVRRDGEAKDFSVTVAPGPQRIRVRRQDLEAALAPFARRVEPPDAPDVVVRPPTPAIAATPMPAMPRMFVFPPNGMFGASLTAVGPELAKALNIKLGVLATEVPEESPAWRDGLRSGDVIVSVEDSPVRSVNEFRDRVLTHLQMHSVALQVMRNQRTRTIRLRWPSP